MRPTLRPRRSTRAARTVAWYRATFGPHAAHALATDVRVLAAVAPLQAARLRACAAQADAVTGVPARRHR
jgi:hypothetical protein